MGKCFNEVYDQLGGTQGYDDCRTEFRTCLNSIIDIDLPSWVHRLSQNIDLRQKESTLKRFKN